MNFHYLYARHDGRIGRAVFWGGAVLLAAIVLGITLVIRLQTRDLPGWPPEFILVLAHLLLLHPAAMLIAKRLHDRDWSGFWSLALVAPMAAERVRYLADVSGRELGRNAIDYALIGIILIVAIGFVIELGIRPGTPGPNRFGPDPLAVA